MRNPTILLSLATVLLLSGCATIKPEQCATTDWRQLGVEDGRAGYASTRLAKHREACAEVKVAPDAKAWEAGRSIGLREFCRLPNAVDHGLDRKSYERVCDDPRFARLYETARSLGNLRYEIETIDKDIESRDRQLITNKKLSDKRRAEIRSEIRNLERRRDRVRSDLRHAEYRLDIVRRETGI